MFFNLLIVTILVLFINKIQSQIVSNLEISYNYINDQNYVFDLLYDHITGTNLYFYSSDNLTLFMVYVNPKLQLNIEMKIYTNDTILTDTIKNGQQLYFGIDFNTTNTDVTTLMYRTDILLCKFSSTYGSCSDYAYNNIDNVYIPNIDENLVLNNLIPAGFNNTYINILDSNVLVYNAYYSLYFEKLYPAGFDNFTMTKWMDSFAGKINATITVFYGIYYEYSNDIIGLQDTYYNCNSFFNDGQGLQSYGEYLTQIRYTIILILFIIF